MDEKQKLIKHLIGRYQELSDERSAWIPMWKCLSSVFDPMVYRDEYENSESGKVRDLINKEIIDNAGILAVRDLASGMQGGMTSPARPWFALRESGFELSNDKSTAHFLSELDERIRVIFATSGFYNMTFQIYKQLAVIGTALAYADANLDGFHFRCVPVGTYVLDVDYYGKVDTVIRKEWLTWRQIEQEFGESVIPDEIKINKENNKHYRTNKNAVYHAVFPNKKSDVIKNSINPKNKNVRSIYYMERKDTKGQYIILRDSGYDNMPFFGIRWDVNAGDTYGRSPALDVLGTNKMLQKIVEDMATGIHKQVDPPVNAPSSMENVGVDLSAGAINFMPDNLSGNTGVTPSIQVGIDVNAAMMYSEQIKQSIKVGLYNDLFRMLMDSNRRQITAMEIASKEEEKLILVGPVLERIQDEFFIPLIYRTVELMGKYDALPPIPESMQGEDIKIEFVSTLAQAQKIVSTGSIQQLVAFAGNVGQMVPSVLDKLDTDVIIDKYGEYLGTDSDLLRSNDQVASIRQQRAQAEAQAQAQMQTQQMVQMANAMGNTPLQQEGAPSALDAVLGGLGSV